MECKFYLFCHAAAGSFELIDTLWNVNEGAGLTDCQRPLELIDTLWNVNYRFKKMRLNHLLELIDTLWNVN